MSHPDYEQFSHDHAALLVLVRPLGSLLRPHTFARLFERIGRVNTVRVTDGAGHTRSILVRYVREHPVENNDWGDFQTHRRLLGLITIGKYDSQQELNEICRVHESLKVKYTTTLYDSRCILIRPSSDLDSPTEPETSSSSTSSTTTSGADPPASEGPSKDISPEEVAPLRKPTEPVTATHEQKVAQLLDTLRHSSPVPSVASNASAEHKFHTPSNFKTRALFYTENDPCLDLEQVMSEYVSSLFWVLDGKRLERSREKLDKVPLLLAPFEKKDFVGLDMESRNNKKRCTGRITKNLGDLCLQAGLLQESLAYYGSAAETLRSVNDLLWLGAAFEGLCATSALCLYPYLRGDSSSGGFHRNASLQEPASSTTSTKQHQHLMQLQVRGLEEELLTTPRELPSGCLPAEDISRRYREAIIYYSNYQNAGIIETEASFKAARISVAQNHPLQAASFLQNVVFINLTLSEQEKIQRFETLSELYTQIGFMRKAAFCQRLAATRYVSPQNPTPNWTQCYTLMLQSFPGHKLTLDPTELTSQPPQQIGWPALQIQLLSELVVAAKRMGHSALATRHMTFLLQTMWPHLSVTDQREFSVQLQSLSAQCEGAPVPLVLDSGLVIPPANLSNIPVCLGFNVCQLDLSLKPRKIETEKSVCGPFLFTPINFGSLERKSNKPNNFVWVENEPCYVIIQLSNPLPYELRVSNMRLLTSGVVFESLPESVVLPQNPASSTTTSQQQQQPADSSLSSVSSITNSSLLSSSLSTVGSSGSSGGNSVSITLHGTPRENGDLELLGYSTHALGVKSNCRLRYMPRPSTGANAFLSQYNVEVIPSLPTMEVKTTAPALNHLPLSTVDEQVTGAVVTSAAITVYNGEEAHMTVTFTNVSANDIPVEMLDVSMTMLPSHQNYSAVAEQIQQVFSWSQEELAAQLPLAPGSSATLIIHIHTAPVLHHLVTTDSTALSLVPPGGLGVNSPLSSLSLGATGVGSGVPSRINSPVTIRTNTTAGGASRALANASFRSASSMQSHSSDASYNSGAMSGRSPMPPTAGAPGINTNSHVLHAQLQVRYSGGPGLHTAAYCRLCAVHVVVETLPSLHVTNWDVLPSAEQPDQFYLVLDVANQTGHEMELEYTEGRCMFVEATESCRVPVPVDRCPLAKLQQQLQQHDLGVPNDTSNNTSYQQQYLQQQQNMFRSDAERICSEHITDLVSLNWRLLNGSSSNGTVCLRGILLSPAMLDVVRMSPLSWEVHINDERPRSSEPLQCVAGDCLAVRIRMRNCLGRPLRHLRAQLHLYQDYRNGTENRRLETRLAVTGPSHLCVDCLPAEGVAEHSCNVLIFTPGHYKMDVHCTGSDMLDQLDQPIDCLVVQQQQQQQQQLWKYMPAIELLVGA